MLVNARGHVRLERHGLSVLSPAGVRSRAM